MECFQVSKVHVLLIKSKIKSFQKTTNLQFLNIFHQDICHPINNLNKSVFAMDYLIEIIGQRFRIVIIAMWYILDFRTDGIHFHHTKAIYVSCKLNLCNAFA